MNFSEACWCQQHFSAYKERIPSVQETSRHSICVENLGRVIAVVHRTESNSFFVSPAPWSAPGLSSLWLPAAAPTCGSLVLRTPRWRRAHQISHWNPSRRKTWWGSMERTWSEMWPLVRMFVTVPSFLHCLTCLRLMSFKLPIVSNRGVSYWVLMSQLGLKIFALNFSADWRVTRGFGEAEEQRDALGEEAGLASLGMYSWLDSLRRKDDHSTAERQLI